jgi:hypothetical protein
MRGSLGGARVEKIYTFFFFNDVIKTFKLMARGGTLSTHTHPQVHGSVSYLGSSE